MDQPPSQLLKGGPVELYVTGLHERLRSMREGEVATYIPELAKADPGAFAIVIATVDGQIYAAGDATREFTIQSISKPFLFGYCLGTYGRDQMLNKVGVEPSGDAFNAIVFDEVGNRPFNPMVNAGAIAATALVKGADTAARIAAVQALFGDLTGRPVAVDRAVFLSEKQTGHRNRAIAHMMLNSGMIEDDPEGVLDVYFSQCALSVTCCDLAVMAATLAAGGVQPLSGKRVLAPEHVRDVLTVMNSCGMYNYAGEWSYEIGMPAKSGVSGGILAVAPGQLGIGIFSPRLDRFGNSVRGVRACLEISRDFGLHAFQTHTNPQSVIRRELDCGSVRSKRRRSAAERAVLDHAGRRIRIVEVQGALFFGSSERLVRRVMELGRHPGIIILDVQRVSAVDAAASQLLAGLKDWATGQSLTLVIVGAPKQRALAALAAATGNGRDGAVAFEDVDLALQWSEDQILAGARAPVLSKLALGSLDLFRGLTRAELGLLERVVHPMSFDRDAIILRQGDPAHLFFVLAKGSVSVRVRDLIEPPGRGSRIASIGPGTAFGEMALLDGGLRSADVVADEPVVCYGFSVQELQDIGREHPRILATILSNITADLSERLRLANQEIRALRL